MNSPIEKYLSTNCLLLTTNQAAEMLNFKPQTLRKWASTGAYPSGLKPQKIGGSLRWPIEQVTALVMDKGQKNDE
ncbi:MULTISPECIES: helix-turn-helix domain-containing protein [Microvirgula]|uniref:helix-turn-helix domain-containing protein n=1 Tax=Microvirgula TaxID=57479 RepID=UPI000A05685A|nr:MULTISPECIES: helix-turn-helix domain-containing protein [Microvirgula]